MAIEAKEVSIKKPDSAGYYWWRKSPHHEWEIVKVTGSQGEGWGLCVTKNTHHVTVNDFGGEWHSEILRPT
jgi:hypothetical protein